MKSARSDFRDNFDPIELKKASEAKETDLYSPENRLIAAYVDALRGRISQPHINVLGTILSYKVVKNCYLKAQDKLISERMAIFLLIKDPSSNFAFLIDGLIMHILKFYQKLDLKPKQSFKNFNKSVSEIDYRMRMAFIKTLEKNPCDPFCNVLNFK